MPSTGSQKVVHETLTFERTYPAAPERVFRAYADVTARARWGTPSDTAAIVYSESDFRVGGLDQFRCGAKDELPFRGHVRYEDIVENRRIVYVECVSHGDDLLSVSLVTWEVEAVPTGSRLRITDQLMALDGADMITGTRQGTNTALDNLGRELAT